MNPRKIANTHPSLTEQAQNAQHILDYVGANFLTICKAIEERPETVDKALLLLQTLLTEAGPYAQAMRRTSPPGQDTTGG